MGLPGVKLVLVLPGDCPVIGETTSDVNGEFVFTNLKPSPDYLLYFLPPAGFNFAGDNPAGVWVIANQPGRMTFVAEAGDAPPPQVPTNPASCTPPPTTTAPPAPQASSGSGLAQTGSDVRSLGIVGLLVLLLGSAFVLAGHRRRAKEMDFLRP